MVSARKYDKEFKQNAIELFLSSGKSLRQFAREIDVPWETLKWWRNAHLKKIEGTPERYKKESSSSEMAKEIYNLKRENAKLKVQRDILKKALGILSD